MKKEEIKKEKPLVKKLVAKKKPVVSKVTEKKVTEKKATEKKVTEKRATEKSSHHYYEATGRRKTAVARVRLYAEGGNAFIVNQKDLKSYFPTFDLQEKCLSGLDKMKCVEDFKTVVLVKGGGPNAQAEAIRHGIARALVLFNAEFKKKLRKVGYLTRDPRKRERKKFGLKRARRAPQWKKR